MEATKARISVKGLKGKILTLLVGVFTSWATVNGTMSPFAAAFVAAAPNSLCAYALTGTLIGGFLPYGAPDKLRTAAALIAAAGIRLAFSELKKVSSHPVFAPVAAFCSIVMTGVVVSGASGAKISYDMIMYIAEGILSAMGAYFFARAFEAVRAGRLYALRREETGALTACVCMAATGICRVSFWGFSPGRLAVLFVMLQAAREKKETGGAIAGISAGVVMALSGSSLAMSGICAIAGLAAGVFANLGTLAASVAAVAVGALASYTSGTVNFFILSEMMTAAVLFRLIPENYIDTLMERMGMRRVGQPKTLPGTLVAKRLEDAAKALGGVSETVEKVSRRLSRYKGPGVEQIYRQATETICSACPLSRHCWENEREETQTALDELTPLLKKDGSLTTRTLPAGFRDRCARKSEMMEEINSRYAEYTARESAKRRIAQVRCVIGDQLGGVSMMLTDLAEKTRDDDTPDEEAQQQVSDALRRSGYIVESVRCIENSTGRLSVTAKVGGRRGKAIARNELIYELEDALHMPLETPAIEGGAEFTISTSQMPALDVEFGAAQHCCSGENLCGDAYEAFLDSEGNAVMILSDGMGSGGRAAVDSAMTCALTGKLLKAGFNFEGAMKIVNAALMIKSDDESLATLDVTRINLFTGGADICKAGAVKTYIVSEGEVRPVSSESLPLGILREVRFSSESQEIREGDVILMMSDGVPDTEGWLEGELTSCEMTDMRTLSRQLLQRAQDGRTDGDDDITILAARINAA